ncbi:hypothetical protein PsorP6_000065 [Peronosclerospora sorghi]|uniref:Uncharacterized protein n=1 Tax=Peronosclerospora sorghi TaxID=230839 RepID=A0ACC0WNY7_9STRA|nr:hypothetical protein PsorP6_000065 [Peronosclerospora sorghi]
MYRLFLRVVAPFGVPDAEKFTLLAYTSVVVGGICTIFFLSGTPEKVTVTKRQQEGSALAPNPVMAELKGHGLSLFCEEMPVSDVVSESMTWTCWFKLTSFYQVAIVYMCTRLIVNITQAFLSFYLIVTLEMSATSIAIVPLLVYLSGFVATFCLRRLNESIVRAGSFALGAGLIVLLLTLSYYISPDTACGSIHSRVSWA